VNAIFTALVLSLPLVGAYGIFAVGIVLIYRASRMLNLAHGAMAMVPAYLLYSLAGAGVPVPAAFLIAVASGGALGFVVEKVFVSRLRSQGSTAQTVGTVAALGIMVALVARVYGTASLTPVEIFPRGHITVGLSSIQFAEIGLFLVMLAVAAVLFILIQRTDLGLMMRGSAESRLAASLMGVNPSRITSFTWILGGALAGLAGILLASVTTLHPYTLALQVLPAFIAALLGGLGSLPGALLGAAVVGVTQGLVPVLGPIGQTQGAPQLFLAVLAIVVMAIRGRKLATGIEEGERRTAATDEAAPTSSEEERERVARAALAVRRRRAFLFSFLVILALAFPFIEKIPSSVVGSANLAASYALVAVSIVLLTGWVGQISLGHAALVGIGAYVTGHAVVVLEIPFPLSLPLAAAGAAVAAGLLGAVALRVRGLYLAVATLVFSWMSSEFLFRQEWFISNGQIPAQAVGLPGAFPAFDLANRRIFYLVAWAVTAGVIVAVANLRDSKTGRAFFAVRGSETAAASLGIHVMRYKFLAFAVSGGIAGIAGNLIMTDARVVTADQFTFNISLFFLAVAVVGGLTSLSGAVASGLLFAGLSELFFRVQFLGAFIEIVSSLLLAVTLLAYSGGLASLPPKIGRVLAPLQRRLLSPLYKRGAAVAGASWQKLVINRRTRRAKRPRTTAPAVINAQASGETSAPLDFGEALATLSAAHSEPPPEPAANGKADLEKARARISEIRPAGAREERKPFIEASGITVRFGGLTAVNNASLEVREGEIVGLIGPNGAGKTTLFNAIAGYNSPAAGTIRLHGTDVTGLPVHRRARVGVARTFQLIQLFSQQSVRQNLLTATHVHNPTGFVSHITVSPRSVRNERQARRRVDEILRLLDLDKVAETRAGDLPFGVLRMVEVARALVTGFRLIMLDEPASGLDNNETDRLMEVLRFVRGLGVTMLLIEHDVRMVTGVSDYMYVLDQGSMIAEGTPEEIQRDPAVIGAYLGEPAKEEVA
jgi:ABC-type branched-subunit amino acid transport system ATPase component/branched-subunit amino acid ABC-type transport system permease component